MKLIDRIRPIADTPEYSEFAELWRGFQETQRMKAGCAHRMIQLGHELMRQTARAGTEHAKAQVRNPFALTEPQADQLVIESERGLSRCVQKVMPELHAYAEFIDAALRERRPRLTPMEA